MFTSSLSVFETFGDVVNYPEGFYTALAEQ